MERKGDNTHLACDSFYTFATNKKHMSNLQIYAEAVRVIKEAILRSQYRAASSAIWYRLLCFKEFP